MSSDQPVDPRLDRYRPLSRSLQQALLACAVLAALSVLLPDPVGSWCGGAVVVLLVVAPVARVLWLVTRWFRRGDTRFAMVGCGVLAVIAAGVGLALLGV